MILSLDLSTKSSGFAVFSEKDKALKDSGLITASSTNVIARIYKMRDSLKKYIEDNKDIHTIVMEEVIPDFQNNHTHKVLLWLQAAIIFMLYDNFPDMKTEFILPNSWRKTIGIETSNKIKRQELKQADIKFVNKKFNINTNSDDIADAIALGYAFLIKDSEEINWE